MIEKVKQFLGLKAQREALESQVEAIKKEMADLEGALLKEFSEQGVQNLNVDGQTVYLHRKLVARARGGDRGAVIQALRDAGLTDYVTAVPTFNTQSLEAWIRAQEESGEPMPEPLRQTLDIQELYFVRTRRG